MVTLELNLTQASTALIKEILLFYFIMCEYIIG